MTNYSSMMRSSMRNKYSSISFWISLCFSLTRVMNSSSNSSMSWTMTSMKRGTMTNSNWSTCSNIGSNNFTIMTHNMSCVNGLGRHLLASCGDNLLAVFGDGGVHNFIIFLMTNLSWFLHISWNTLYFRN